MTKSKTSAGTARCPNCDTPISMFQATLASVNLECRSCGYALVRRDGLARVLAVPAALGWLAVIRTYGLTSLESGAVLLLSLVAFAVHGLVFAKVELKQP